MCMEDIRLGRQLSPNGPRRVAVGVGPTLLADQDPDRTRLILASSTADTVLVWPGPVSSPIQGGWTLTPQTPSVVLRVEDWGKLIQGPWSAIGLAVGAPVFVTEATLEKQ